MILIKVKILSTLFGLTRVILIIFHASAGIRLEVKKNPDTQTLILFDIHYSYS